MDKKVLFLHMPKCAGTSMKGVFQKHFKEEFKLDNENLFKFQIKERIAKIEEFIKDPEPIEKKFTFGHFFPIKYFGSYGKEKDVFLTTFLRDPISRLASHYSFWKTLSISHYLQKKMTMENWSFEEFALSEEMRNFYSQYMFQTPLSEFNYIGIHEDMENSWKIISKILNINCELPKLNSSNSERIKISNSLKEKIKEFHAEDYLIYNHALERHNWLANSCIISNWLARN